MPAQRPARPPVDATAPVPGWRLEVLPTSPSTNEHVRLRALHGEPPGLVVVAEHQTSGRGRLDRSWVTPPRAALTFSLMVAPEGVPLARWSWLPLLSGLAVVEGVRRAAGLATTLKWPNDVLVGDDKVAGILVERVERPAGAIAVVGVGINVSSTREELPVPTATSLELAGATSVDRTALLVGTLGAFSRLYNGWLGAAGRGLRPSYVAACSTLGRRVRVELPTGGSLTGQAVGIDDSGRLEVDDGSGVRVLGAGDVVHVSPV